MKQFLLNLDEKLFLQLWEYAIKHKVKGQVNKSESCRHALRQFIEINKKITDDQLDKLLSMSKKELKELL